MRTANGYFVMIQPREGNQRWTPHVIQDRNFESKSPQSFSLAQRLKSKAKAIERHGRGAYSLAV